MARRYWTCRKCGTRHERTTQVCRAAIADGEECSGRRPKPRVPKHARTLQDDSYQSYLQVASDIHGVTDESCCVCGKPRHELMHHHRDHDHVSGQPRGVVCFQCNQLMPRLLTPERARLILSYLERCEAFYGAYSASEAQL